MEWMIALMLAWGSLTTAADVQSKAEAIQAELDKAEAVQAEIAKAEAVKAELALQAAETSMYGDYEAEAILSASWTLFPETAYQGDAVLIRSQTEGEIEWQNKTYPLLTFGKGYFVMIPISMDTKPGKYKIGEKELTVKAKKFDTQRITVTKEQEEMQQNTVRINEDQKKINKARSYSEPTFLYKENFIQPIEGRLSTPYGFTRYVNGKFSGSHKAIDLAAPAGTPIKATNSGKVVLAEMLYLTGNSIYIDHGMNLFSQYAHLSKLAVKVGDEVKVGDIIGYVGTTGFSTGPHLHFTFWIGNNPVNPNLFFNTTPFKWLNP